MLLLALVWRLAYVFAQVGADPFFDRPILDGAYYLEWAAALASGNPGPGGAFYLAPLYPHLLALFLVVAGKNFFLLYLGQHLLSLLTAAVIAVGEYRALGRAGATMAGALFLLYSPLVFFASRPVGETLALLLLFASLALVGRGTDRSTIASGLLAGLSVLARPNLLLVVLVWMLGDAVLRRWRRALLLVAGVAFVVLPVSVRNLVQSGHLVPVSSNAGITAYHGNGPGAIGIFTHPAGFVGPLQAQREEATELARLRSGRHLDAVEADRWWGRQARRTRTGDPWGSLALFGRKAMLFVDNHEHGLDYHPELDENVWRPRWRWGAGQELSMVPFALLLGLALAALALGGGSGSGGWRVWTAFLACAATPLLFYVSARYRLPAAALLTIPAGAGLAGLLGVGVPATARRRLIALGVALGVAALSLLAPSGELRRIEEAAARSNRSVAHKAKGNLVLAEREARESVRLDPDSSRARFNLGVILEALERLEAAEEEYRQALRLDPEAANAAGNLGGVLIRQGRTREAVLALTDALKRRPAHPICWTNLVVALAASGELKQAKEMADRAREAGVTLDSELLDFIDSGVGAAVRPGKESAP